MYTLYKRIYLSIQTQGFVYYLKLKSSELLYKHKLKQFNINYPEGNIPLDANISLNKDAKVNQASPYYEIKKAFSFINIKHKDIYLLDIGCGFGKVLNLGMMLHFKKVIGIDLDKSAVDTAIKNCEKVRMNGYLTDYNVSCADASIYLIPDGVNVIYLANPFGKSTMENVLDNIMQYFHQSNLPQLFIVYYKPLFADLILNYQQSSVIFESYSTNKILAELAIFKIQANQSNSI